MPPQQRLRGTVPRFAKRLVQLTGLPVTESNGHFFQRQPLQLLGPREHRLEGVGSLQLPQRPGRGHGHFLPRVAQEFDQPCRGRLVIKAPDHQGCLLEPPPALARQHAHRLLHDGPPQRLAPAHRDELFGDEPPQRWIAVGQQRSQEIDRVAIAGPGDHRRRRPPQAGVGGAQRLLRDRQGQRVPDPVEPLERGRGDGRLRVAREWLQPIDGRRVGLPLEQPHGQQPTEVFRRRGFAGEFIRHGGQAAGADVTDRPRRGQPQFRVVRPPADDRQQRIRGGRVAGRAGRIDGQQEPGPLARRILQSLPPRLPQARVPPSGEGRFHDEGHEQAIAFDGGEQIVGRRLGIDHDQRPRRGPPHDRITIRAEHLAKPAGGVVPALHAAFYGDRDRVDRDPPRFGIRPGEGLEPERLEPRRKDRGHRAVSHRRSGEHRVIHDDLRGGRRQSHGDEAGGHGEQGRPERAAAHGWRPRRAGPAQAPHR